MPRAILIVVDNPANWPLDFPGTEVVSAKEYLTDHRYLEGRSRRRVEVYNLCRSYRYQSLGYYVSLLAAARGHRVRPSASAVRDLKSQTIVRLSSEELDSLIQKSFAPIQSTEFVLSIYFGRNLAKRYDALAQQLFEMFQAPFLRATFVVAPKSGKWVMTGIRPLSANEVPEEHRPFLLETAQRYFSGQRRSGVRRRNSRFDLAILVDPKEKEPPSDSRALKKFYRAAEQVGFAPEFISREDFARLSEFDALFIRETTNVNHHTYRFARRAEAEGLVVVDDTQSILKCTNKVFLAEILERHRIPVPRTLIVHRDNRDSVAEQIAYPIILKQPDSSFSQGVVKVASPAEYREAIGRLLDKSDLVIAQEYLPTEFDWRIGIFDRQPVYACRYHMAKGHWQILKRDSGEKKEGAADTLPVEQAPERVVKTALKAANLIGEGFYGVDLKQVGQKVFVIEVNDNPSIESNVEDKVLKDELYSLIMRVMLRRVERRKEL